MADTFQHDVHLPDPEATSQTGVSLARVLRPGDTVLLSGPIGAGKSHLARAAIQEMMRLDGYPIEEVPSPTFTLVQVYDLPRGEVWHVDLYRLSETQDAIELGLDDAFSTAICMVEWPDRLGPDQPSGALHITLEEHGDGRLLHISGPADRWSSLSALEGTRAG